MAEPGLVLENREHMWNLLIQAAQLEHLIMCQYLYASFSLKTDPDEGLTAEQADAVGRWRKSLTGIAIEEMLHLALVANVMTAIGVAPSLTRPNFPRRSEYLPPGVQFALLPFGEASLTHFLYLERPEGMARLDAAGFVPGEPPSEPVEPGEVMPRMQDFSTVGHLYRAIMRGLSHLAGRLGEQALFVGPPRAQATPELFRWPQVQTAGIQRSIRLESQALWALSVLIGLAAFAILGQSLARQTYLDSADLPALWALGFSRAQLFSLGILRAAIIGMAAACVVVPSAVLLSPLTPVGLARIAEPDPGFAVDAWPLVLGAVLAGFLTVLASAVPAWAAVRTATVRREGPGPGRARSPAFTAALSRAWRSPAAATGIRMALQPGRGRTAVPVRSAIFGATLGVAALTASLVFSASLGHLLDTPRLSGFTWDAFVSVAGGQSRAAAALRADPKIAGYTRGGFTGVRIGQVKVMALVLGTSGPARPVITAGAVPAAGDEVALGASTMRAAHTALGRTVTLVLDQAEGHPKPARMRVVGTVIVPPTPFLVTKLGEGAAVALPGYVRIDPGAARRPGGLPFLVRFAPGVSRDAGLAAVAKDIEGLPGPYVTAADRPANVVSLASIAGLPVALSGLLALMATGTLAHMLASSTRSRRRDLAILKTLGFARWQIRRAVAWQATTIAAIALGIGLPAGIAGGRWAWRVFAAQLGVLPEPAIPLATILIAVPAALALANLIAAAPGQAAARTKPATILRAE